MKKCQGMVCGNEAEVVADVRREWVDEEGDCRCRRESGVPLCKKCKELYEKNQAIIKIH